MVDLSGDRLALDLEHTRELQSLSPGESRTWCRLEIVSPDKENDSSDLFDMQKNASFIQKWYYFSYVILIVNYRNIFIV